MRLENKVAVVTGASSGMGKAITTRFVQGRDHQPAPAWHRMR